MFMNKDTLLFFNTNYIYIIRGHIQNQLAGVILENVDKHDASHETN